jgi:hypothetical protein
VLLPLSRPSNITGRPELPVSQLERALEGYGTPTLQAMALEGFVIAKQKFLPFTRLRDVLEAYTRWSEGGRGYLVSLRWGVMCVQSGNVQAVRADQSGSSGRMLSGGRAALQDLGRRGAPRSLEVGPVICMLLFHHRVATRGDS